MDVMKTANITWLTNDRGIPGRPYKEKELFRQRIMQLESDIMFVWPIKPLKGFARNLLEVQAVHEVQEIPN